MTQSAQQSTVFYPDLGSLYDLWYVRLSGVGIGNCFYNYFHAAVLAEKYNGRLITPPWFSLKIGPILRGERSKRFYWRMFKPYPGEIFGLAKLGAMLAGSPGRHIVEIDGKREPVVSEGKLNRVTCKKFTFTGLHDHRDSVRKRLLAIVNDPVPADQSWGKSNFIGMHVRLGDFQIARDTTQATSGASNTRIPMSWYINLTRALRARYPQMPIRIFSDGQDAELQPLLGPGTSIYRSGSDMGDLLAMASASILVGSNSTYSRWAAFLGNMPTIWLDTQTRDEKPSAADAPILFIPLDAAEPALWQSDAYAVA
jgi:hypothetical protein